MDLFTSAESLNQLQKILNEEAHKEILGCSVKELKEAGVNFTQDYKFASNKDYSKAMAYVRNKNNNA